MLQTIRSKTAGVVVRVLFLLLVASFALWGIGDYAFLRRGEEVAIQVGDVKVTPEQLSIEYRREVDRLRRMFGQFDLDLARQIGLIDQVVERVVRDSLFEQEAARLGIVVSDEVVRSRIAADPQFRGPGGTFDRDVFQRVLYESGYGESQYIQLLRQSLMRSAIADSVSAGARAPDILVDRLYRHREERRVGEMLAVPSDSITDVGEPDEAQLKSVYDDNTEQFGEPEFRALSVLRLGVEDLMPTIEVTEEQLQEEYQQRIAEFRVPEKRDLEQMLFSDEAAAKAAAEEVKSGTSFADVAQEANQSPEQTKLDGVQKIDLPELGEAVFALPEGGVAGPLETPFGWHVVRVVKIHPGQEPTLDELRHRLKEDIARRLSGNAAYDTAIKVEDAIASGASLADAASQVGLKITTVPAIDARGLNQKSEAEPVLVAAPEAVQAAFQTPQGQTSQLVETRSGPFYFVHVDGITPPRVKPLEEVRAEVVEMWKAEQRSAAARKRAETIVEKVAQGKTLAEAGAEFDLKPQTTPAVRRDGTGEEGRVASEVAAQLFSMKPNDAGIVAARDGHSVVRLSEIRPADPAADAEGMERLRATLDQQIGGDLVAEMAQALRERYPVTVDTAVIERLL